VSGAHAATGAAGQAARTGRVRAFLRLVAIEHSVFALPFAYLATLTAMHAGCAGDAAGVVPLRRRWGGDSAAVVPSCDGLPVHWGVLALVTVAMVAARTFAMAANRVLDREVDARNPRTAQRELVTGAVSVRTAWTGAAVALVVFLAAAAALGPLPLLLAPLAVVPLVVYPYAKRFTDYPHAVLGLAQAVAPVGAWIAVTGQWSWTAAVLGLAVGAWIGGFDLIYACQDTASDREQGVRSLPARYGDAVALQVARWVHVVAFGLFAAFGLLAGLGWLWWLGLAAAAAAFVSQHRIVSPTDLSRVDRAFFTSNGFVGVVLGLAGVLDLALLR
jgi:4-hydroxybenzoate polyprenyltransferase